VGVGFGAVGGGGGGSRAARKLVWRYPLVVFCWAPSSAIMARQLGSWLTGVEANFE